MDFIEGLPKSDSYDSILVVVDRLTKIAHFLPLKHPFTAQGIAQIFLDHIVKLHELWYNSSHHSSLGCSPFKALYGYDPNVGVLPDSYGSASNSVDQMVKDRKAHIDSLKAHLAAAQNKMKIYADRARTQREFQVNDRVLLKLQPYVQTSVASHPYPKLAFKYFGPYTVVERLGGAAYRLQLPPGSLIHPVFHVSQLKPFTPDYSPVFSDVSTFVPLDTAYVSPEVILDRRLVKKGNQAITQVLIKWSNLPASSATWEDYDVLKTRFP
ncbi:hypothetical protein BS78_K181900, partial [Paspalum vaginatum]